MKQRQRELNRRQERFCLEYFLSGNASEAARLAGYSPKGTGANSHQVLSSALVQARLNDLKAKAQEAARVLQVKSIMSVLERQQRLSIIGRANLINFVDADGNIDLSHPDTEAIAELTVEDWQEHDGERPSSRTKKVKLHSPLQAIDLLNKMDKMYSENEPPKIQTNIVFVIGKGYVENDPNSPSGEAYNQLSIPASQQDPK
jgi:phage terminase small subunit